MASIPIKHDNATTDTVTGTAPLMLLAYLAPLTPDALTATLTHLSAAFQGREVMVAAPDLSVATPSNVRMLSTTNHGSGGHGGWVLSAADFVDAYAMATQQNAAGCLLLGGESQSLSAEALWAMQEALSSGADLVVPRYQVGSREGLVNSAILYPVCRAVLGTSARHPLAPDLGLSVRMAERMASCGARLMHSGHGDALLWPVSEAAVAGYTVVETDVTNRTLPLPASLDLNTLLGNVTGSLFADLEARAAFWQRNRLASRQAVEEAVVPSDGTPADTRPMQDAFQLAHKNLSEIWSLVLPPNSLLGLKRLSQASTAQFRMPDTLWARIIYDFLLAYRLRTINRGHLLGALTPLYLAWVASHLDLIHAGLSPEQHIEQQAQAFEFDKPYLVSRWRWPDRFNP